MIVGFSCTARIKILNKYTTGSEEHHVLKNINLNYLSKLNH